MPVEPDPIDTQSVAIICTPPQHCDQCGGAVYSPTQAPALQITTVERKADGIVTTGRIPVSYCPRCAAALHEIRRVVPIELKGLACKCGSEKFRFSVRSIKPNKAKDPTDWNFELDAVCLGCDQTKFHEKILNFFRLKKVKVGVTGIDVEMFPERKG
jgi:hypothetical protein